MPELNSASAIPHQIAPQPARCASTMELAFPGQPSQLDLPLALRSGLNSAERSRLARLRRMFAPRNPECAR